MDLPSKHGLLPPLPITDKHPTTLESHQTERQPADDKSLNEEITVAEQGDTKINQLDQRPNVTTSDSINVENGISDPSQEPALPESKAPDITVEEVPHCVLSEPVKISIIITASFAAIISPISGSIYFPALNSLADDLNVSESLINLTITTYLVSKLYFTRRTSKNYADSTDRSFKVWHHPSLETSLTTTADVQPT